MGRPRAIQGEVEKILLDGLRRGLTIRLACQYAGISQDTWQEELKRNPSFAEAASRARLSHLPEALDNVRQAGKQDWRAADRFLQLVAPGEYNPRQQVELSQSGPLAITLDFGGAPAPAQSSDAKD